MATNRELLERHGISADEIADMETKADAYDRGEWPVDGLLVDRRPLLHQDDLPEIFHVEHLEGTLIVVSYKTGEKRIFDATYLLKRDGVFKALRDPGTFHRTLTVRNKTLAWDLYGDFDPSNCIEIAPESVYTHSVSYYADLTPVEKFMLDHDLTDEIIDKMAEPYEDGTFEPSDGVIFRGCVIDALDSTPAVIHVEPLNDHELIATFESGEKHIYDASELLEHDGVFEDLCAPGFFRHALAVTNGALSWNISGKLRQCDCVDTQMKEKD